VIHSKGFIKTNLITKSGGKTATSNFHNFSKRFFVTAIIFDGLARTFQIISEKHE
jgi:hypothetical protein